MTFTSICVVWYKYNKLPLGKTDCTDNKQKILLFQPILISVSLYFSVFGFIACAFGTYGVNCKFDCRCGGKECNSITGECFCDPGKTGPSCVDGKFFVTLSASPICQLRARRALTLFKDVPLRTRRAQLLYKVW